MRNLWQQPTPSRPWTDCRILRLIVCCLTQELHTTFYTEVANECLPHFLLASEERRNFPYIISLLAELLIGFPTITVPAAKQQTLTDPLATITQSHLYRPQTEQQQHDKDEATN